MNKYVIDYGFGTAYFWTEATDPVQVRRDFYECANECFGIRKSMSGYEIERIYENTELPLPYRGQDATHFLSHSGDDILFDRRFQTPDGRAWKLHHEGGDWCSCAQRGTPELSCEVHHYAVADHDAQCRCQEKG